MKVQIHILWQIKVQDSKASREVDMILDTGAWFKSFSWDTLKDIGYDPAVSLERIPIVTANGSIEVPMLKVDRIVWGDNASENVDVICHNIPELVWVDGLFGLSFLQNFDVSLNFKKGILEIT